MRRSVLGEQQLIQQLRSSLSQASVSEQLAQLTTATTVIAPHGAAMANLIAATPETTVPELVNPAYQPGYFDGLICRQLRHQRLKLPTPLPLQEWLYEGPLSFPIDLRPGASAAEALASGAMSKAGPPKDLIDALQPWRSSPIHHRKLSNGWPAGGAPAAMRKWQPPGRP